MENLDLRIAVISTFFHDIGKGGDCINDMYSSEKYNEKENSVHPEFSGNMILDEKQFIIDCNIKEKINIKNLILKYIPKEKVNEVSLAAFMYWEFGKLNIVNNGYSLDNKINNYLS